MYFQWLNLLKGSNSFSEDDIRCFDNLLFQIYAHGYWRRFSPKIYKYFDIHLNEEKWIKALEILDGNSIAERAIELCHPTEGNTVMTFSKFSDLPLNQSITLPNSEDELFFSEGDIHITFSLPENLMPREIAAGEKMPKKPLRDQ